MKHLAIDTSLEHLSLSLSSNSESSSHCYLLAQKRNSTLIFSELEKLFQEQGMAHHELELITVCRGPGSYTGLRIGMAVAQTLAQVHKLPLVGVHSLELLAQLASPEETKFHVLLNCTRQEVYHCYFERTAEGIIQQSEVQQSQFSELLPKLKGEPSLLYRIPSAKKRVLLLEDELTLAKQDSFEPNAINLAKLGVQLYQSCTPEDLAPVSPLYIKKEVERTN